ncbi:hypothetical protein P280DRAFT_441370 [Massarina eburnea CBS 473.64]|uniref:F-box domain-containing protein n=1 Tax=Massarina eburnea CBS 473.64 TaxID=1395130 RepID=A0A6A6SHQ5_9PLEO|nr:hypothetical protein P280DRAFT_441370 [Massarina eburnea CBS 473.64]
MTTAGPSILACLPDELLVNIVDHVAAEWHGRRPLCMLALTCKFFQYECEKRIYRKIDLVTTKDLRDILEAFARRPERIASVETLNINYDSHKDIHETFSERQTFNECVKKMVALKNWYAESPFDNFNWNENGGREWVEHDMEVFRRALEGACLHADDGKLSSPVDVGLSKLEELTIHSHGPSSDFWVLDGFHCLFRHPTLRSLHASCFKLPTDIPELEPYARSTALETLVFDECFLMPKSLGRILKTPKNLKHLTLGEVVYNDRRTMFPQPRLTERPEASVEALSAVAHSLETLTHLDPMWKRSNGAVYKQHHIDGPGLRDFHHLTFLDVDPCSFLHQFALSSVQAPPHLETFRIHHALHSDHHDHSFFDLFEELPNFEPYTALSELKTLEFAQAGSLDTEVARTDHICQEDALRERHEYAYKLSKHGINLKIFLQATFQISLVPPYLHNEPAPSLVCVYDAAKLGFRRHVVDVFPLPEHETETETDKLNTRDITTYRNEVRRALQTVHDEMARIRDDSSSNQDFFDDYDDDDDDEEMDVEGDDNEFFDLDSDIHGLDDESLDAEGWFDGDMNVVFGSIEQGLLGGGAVDQEVLRALAEQLGGDGEGEVGGEGGWLELDE